MRTPSAKRLTIVGFVLSLALVGAAALSWACTFQATLDLNPVRVVPGQTVHATGNGYDPLPTSSEVHLRLTGDGVDIPLGTVPVQVGFHSHLPERLAVSVDGQIDADIEIPAEVAPGTYVVVAEQFDATGRPVLGTPALATLLIQAAL